MEPVTSPPVGAPSPSPRKGLSTMAWVLIGLGGGFVVVCVLVAAIFHFVWSATGAPAAAADAFLSHVGKGLYVAAYRSAAPQVRAQVTLDAFTASMKRYNLDKYASASWSSREISPGRATLRGTVRTRDGQTIPATLVLVGADEKWEVYSVRVDLAGVGGIGGDTPGTEEVRRLVLATLLKFNDAVERNDFADFRASLASAMRDKYTADSLRTTFAVFVTNRVNIAGIRDVVPVFDPAPHVDDKGFLRVAGHYPTTPMQVHFTLVYVKEGDDWRLTSINVRTRRPL